MKCSPGFRSNGKPTTALGTPSILVVSTDFPLNRNPNASSDLSWIIAIPPGTSDWRGCADTGSARSDNNISSKVRTSNIRRIKFCQQVCEFRNCRQGQTMMLTNKWCLENPSLRLIPDMADVGDIGAGLEVFSSSYCNVCITGSNYF